jgi:hypothetical protein
MTVPVGRLTYRMVALPEASRVKSRLTIWNTPGVWRMENIQPRPRFLPMLENHASSTN